MARASHAHGRPLIPDPRLSLLAGWVLEQQRGEAVTAPPYPVLDLYTRHLGLPEPTPHLLLLGQPDAAALGAQVEQEIAQLSRQQPYTHYGAAAVARGGGVMAALVLSFRQLTLSPVPRMVEPGSLVPLQGTLSRGLRDAQLIVTYPDGHITRSKRSMGSGIDVQVQTEGAGEYRVELIADSAEGIKVAANFPLYVGVAPAREVTVVAGPGGATADGPQLAGQLLELMNEARGQMSAASAAPVVRDPKLDAVALAHSEDMRAHDFVAHTSPTTGSAVDRVARAGIRTPIVLENIGRGYSAQEIHLGLMQSPGHRENMLNPDATHVGIGVTLATEDEGFAYLVTEVFARFAPRVDVDAARSQLTREIDAAREQAGMSAVRHDPALGALCADAAARFFREAALSKERMVEELTERASASQPAYQQLLAASVIVSAIEEASELELWLEPRARSISIGLAQGTRADTIENAIIVVALIGY